MPFAKPPSFIERGIGGIPPNSIFPLNVGKVRFFSTKIRMRVTHKSLLNGYVITFWQPFGNPINCKHLIYNKITVFCGTSEGNRTPI